MDLVRLARMDIARWIVAGEISDLDLLTRRTAALLVYRNVGLRAVLAMRLGAWFNYKNIPLAPSYMQRLVLRRYGLDVVVGAKMGGGLYVAHPSGTTIAPEYMGENCSVIAAVTIGMRNTLIFPTLGDRVFLGAGCRVLGDITLGDDARVGANAVVVNDVAENTSVVGIPAAPLLEE